MFDTAPPDKTQIDVYFDLLTSLALRSEQPVASLWVISPSSGEIRTLSAEVRTHFMGRLRALPVQVRYGAVVVEAGGFLRGAVTAMVNVVLKVVPLGGDRTIVVFSDVAKAAAWVCQGLGVPSDLALNGAIEALRSQLALREPT